MIYLDNSFITRPSKEAVNDMIPFLTEKWGSSSAPHQWGHQNLPQMEESYRAIYQMLGADENDQFVFMSSGTEAVNHVIQSAYLDVTMETGKNHFITSAIDEAPQIMAMSRLEKHGCVCRMIDVNEQGYVTAEAVGDAMTPRTAFVSLSWANGMTGVIHPVEEIAKVCKERGVLLHLDASHVLGKLYFDLKQIGADLITFEGSLLHAPQGTGGLWIRDGVKLSPLIVGGNEQGGSRAGPMNLAGLVALGKASKQLAETRDLICMEGARLRNQLETGIQKGFPEATPLFTEQERLPNITAIAFPGIVNEALLFALSEKNLFASIGGGNNQQISLILEACKVDPILAQTTVSFSLSRETTDEEIDRAVKVIVETAKQLRNSSSHMVVL
ncbi:MAG: Cysteine desulfurase IscS [Chlamydiae bacterium]|nr:Cysteine desulfurase IscS [Chlamydiota bacterium]